MKDLIEQINAAARTVGAGELPAGPARTVTVERSYPTGAADLWEAITEPDRIARWFLPVSGDLREGGTYRTEGNASGEIRRCDPPRQLVLTWNAPGAPAPTVDDSIVTVTLTPVDDDTTVLQLEHVAVPPPEFWDRFGPGAVGVGWDLALVGLAMHLTGEPIGSPEEMDRDPNVRAAMTASSAAWGEAYRRSGVSDDVAARATAEVTAFYVPPLE